MSEASEASRPGVAFDRPVLAKRRGLALGLLGAGVVGLGLTAARGMFDARVALSAYLVAFTYWLGLGLGALALLMIFLAAKARWMIVIRRTMEAAAGSLVAFPVLFVPIAFGMRTLFPWAGSLEGLDEESVRLVHHRAPYLNPTFFLIRAAIYFIVWVTLSGLLFRWSTRQDETRAPELTARAWKLGAAGLPALGLTLTFASFDWLMSLGIQWYSTIWGVYFFAGSFLGAIALVILISARLDTTPALQGAMKGPHWLSLGKLLLAFTCFWAYIAFSQYMLGWIGNLPSTLPWMLARQNHAYRWLLGALALGHFALPFLLLLSRARKLDPARLRRVAGWLLALHYVDLYWLVMPGVRPGTLMPDVAHLTAFLGVGGVASAVFVMLLGGRHALPVGDPFLAESLGYARGE